MSGSLEALLSTQETVVPSGRSTQLRPVSRIIFTLTDTNAFEKTANFAVDWLASKTGGILPPEARALQSFDTRGMEGYHPCHAVRLNDRQGSIWASRIDEPGSRPEAMETWSTELFVEHKTNGLVRFGAQLSVRRALDADPLRASRPRVVHDLLGSLSVEADGESITENVTRMTSNDVVGLVNLMYRPNRRLPIVVVSDNDQGAAQLDTRKLAVRLSGAAHLIALDAGASWELTRLLGKRMSTFSGAVRIYMPGLVEDEEDAYQHPLWLAPNSGRNNRLIDILAERVFPLGFRDSDGESHFWHLAQLRQTASAAQARRQAGSDVDQLRLEVELLKERLEDVNETLETAEALEKIAADNEKAARYEVELLKNENNRLREKLYHLQYSDSESKCEIPKAVDRHLASYDDIEDWSNDLLGPNIFIHRKALKDCRQNGHPDMLERIENTLLVIRDYWIPYKIHGGIERRNDMITALGRLGVEDEACFARRERAKERDDYSVPDGNVTRILYDHFKYGNSRNNSEQFRIYYSWDEDGKRLIIGKMPSHLPNDMS